MLRRVLAFLALAAVVFAVVGCGDDKNPSVKESVKKVDSQETKKTFTPE
jgi:hypothetical protein